MANITKLPAHPGRVETGPIQFGDDWPGVFIRGDRAGWLALKLGEAMSHIPEAQLFLRLEVQGLINLLGGCVAGPAAQGQGSETTHRMVSELRAREREYAGTLSSVKGPPFKTVNAAKAYRAGLPPGTEFDPSLFGIYAVEGGFVLRRFERDGVSFGAVDPNWVGEDASEAERLRTARRAAFMAKRNLTEDEYGNFVEKGHGPMDLN